MIAEKDKVVTFHYTLKNTGGEEMESSKDRDPMTYLHGANNIITGLEKAMEGHAIADKFSVTVEPEEAYGARAEDNIQRVPLKRLKGLGKIVAGQVLNLFSLFSELHLDFFCRCHVVFNVGFERANAIVADLFIIEWQIVHACQNILPAITEAETGQSCVVK